MNIAHVVSTYPPYRGGMGNVAFQYVERLRARGHNVHVFVPRVGPEVPGDPAYVHRIPSPLQVGNAGVMPSLFRRLAGFDVVHLHYPFFGGAEPTIVRRAMRQDQALVVTYHMDTYADGLKGLIFEAHRRALFPWLMARADRILVSSLDYAESSSLGKLGLQERTEELPFGVDLERFHPGSEPDVRERLGVAPSETLALFVGGMDTPHSFKGVPVLLEALARLPNLPIKVALVGDGDLRPLFEQTAEFLGVSSRVKFLGNAADNELPALYRAADFHVLPSTTRGEAFGIVALEAAASGIPSVVSDLPGVRTVVLDGETGLRVKPGDADALAAALRRLTEESGPRRALGAAARARAESAFAWGPLMDRLEAVYKKARPTA